MTVRPDTQAFLEVDELSVAFRTDHGELRAVDGVSFSVEERGKLGIVGESGCGKSVTALSLMRLLPRRAARLVGGEIRMRGKNLLSLHEREMRTMRGRDLAMIFQEPMTSLNPVYTVGYQIIEAIRAHEKVSKSQARARALDLLKLVGIPAAIERIDSYPHELSGGMRQRIMIAMALSCSPKLLIADEPTTALDVTIQAQILELLSRLQTEFGMSLILITHDLGVVAESVDHVLVMYAGKVVEQAPVRELFQRPLHPYTRGLLRSIPGWTVGQFSETDAASTAMRKRLPVIPGVVPDVRKLPTGCRFQDRCSEVVAMCRESEPPLTVLSPQRKVACFVATQGARNDAA